MLKYFVDAARRRREGVVKEESELSSGMLYATGLVAGGSLGGVLIAFIAFAGDFFFHISNPPILGRLDMGAKLFPELKNGLVSGGILAGAAFAVLCVLLLRNAQRKLEG